MRTFHRLKQTLSVRIEALLDQVENQEALVVATIREVEQGAARVRAHKKACERRIHALGQKGDEHERQVALWRDRARRLGGDREKALECVRRMRAASQAKDDARAELERQEALLRSISEDEQTIDEKLDELRRRRTALSSREARAGAEVGVEGLADIDSVFDRWEARLEQREALSESRSAGADSFAAKLTREEEAVALDAELDRLLSEEQTS
jgi:phage shock protein A